MPLRTLSIDLSKPLDSLIPRSWLHVLPRPLSHFLGYREKPHRKPEIGNVLIAIWSFIGVFCGIAMLEGVFLCAKEFREREAPIIMASFVR